MSKVRRYKTYQYTIAAGESLPLEAPGQFVRCLYASGLVLLAIDDEVQGDFPQGLAYTMPEGQQFAKLRLINPNGAPVTVQVGIGFGRLDDSRSTVTAAVTVALGTVLNNGAVVVGSTAVLIRPALLSRRSLLLHNTGNRECFIGGPGVTIANGMPIGAYGYIGLDGNTADIWGVVSSSTVNVRFLEEA